jgi:hypothetical protein
MRPASPVSASVRQCLDDSAGRALALAIFGHMTVIVDMSEYGWRAARLRRTVKAWTRTIAGSTTR